MLCVSVCKYWTHSRFKSNYNLPIGNVRYKEKLM